MNAESSTSRRALLVKVGLLLNGIVGAALAVPIVRYLLSPLAREENPGHQGWLSLGQLAQFPAGQTRLATYRNPVVNPGDGQTANVACWVRNVDGRSFQVFAVNCAHLGCPVRWFPPVEPFPVPLSRRRLPIGWLARLRSSRSVDYFQYQYKIEAGNLFIQGGELPTPGRPVAIKLGGGTTCA